MSRCNNDISLAVPVNTPPVGTHNGSVNQLQARLQSDLTEAMRNREDVRVATLRMALAALSVEQRAGKAERELTDDDVTVVLRREVKKRREAAAAFADAGRSDSADKERAEEAVLSAYLPAALSVAELDTIVSTAVEAARESGVAGPKAMGVVMKGVQAQVQGRADGAVVAAKVRAALASQ